MKLSELQRKILTLLLKREERGAKREEDDLVLAVVHGKCAPLETIVFDLMHLERAWEKAGSALQFAIEYRTACRDVMRSLKALCKRRLVVDHVVVSSIKTVRLYELTDRGRLFAKKLRFEENVERLKQKKAEGFKTALDEELAKQLNAALKSVKDKLKKEGKPLLATPKMVLEALWEENKKWYEGERAIFDSFWNERKLGKTMKKLLGIEAECVRIGGKVTRLYPIERLDDKNCMRIALAYLARVMRLSHPEYYSVLAGLWLTTGCQTFPSIEAFISYWTKKRVGRVIKALGFGHQRKLSDGMWMTRYNIVRILKEQLTEQEREIVYSAPRSFDLFVEIRYNILVADEKQRSL